LRLAMTAKVNGYRSLQLARHGNRKWLSLVATSKDEKRRMIPKID